jgi:F-type H+-transporting ATPase subunit alpha
MSDRTVLDFVDVIKSSLQNFHFDPDIKEFGTVVTVADGIAKIHGLTDVCLGELVEFENKKYGMVLNLNFDSVDAVLFGKDCDISEHTTVKRTHKSITVPVGKALLGRIVDPLGNPLDGKGPIKTEEYRKIETMAPGILERKSVHEPLQTGIKAIDSLIPIGRGQRELIIGDRQTGKTAIAIDTIINQSKINKKTSYDSEKVFSIYVAIGQKNSTVAKIARDLEDKGALDSTIIVVASSCDPAPLQFLAPYAGCAMGEYFRDNGMHALVVYDDLSKHAVAYRQMSLLLRRPPAREAYPGDVFYIHSRLLERSAKMSEKNGSGSLTAMPIVETQSGDISAYVPTNIISITDGQIFLDNEMFYKGFRPAINPGLSVSRVGSAAQTKAMKQVSAKLKPELAQYRELEAFSKFGSDLDEATISTLDRGRKICQLLVQMQFKTQSLAEQVISLFAVSNGFFKDIAVDKVTKFESEIVEYIKNRHPSIIEQIETNKSLNNSLECELKEVIQKFLEECIG